MGITSVFIVQTASSELIEFDAYVNTYVFYFANLKKKRGISSISS